MRSISFPGWTPVFGVFFFQDERVQIITHIVLEKKPPHTGVDPGKLNERTLYVKWMQVKGECTRGKPVSGVIHVPLSVTSDVQANGEPAYAWIITLDFYTCDCIM